MKIAWIGLGTMGEFMAGHLLDAGHELTVHNRTREREEALAERGARTGGDAAPRRRAGAELVCICVADSPDVEAVVLGPGGVAEGIGERRRGARLLDDRAGHRAARRGRARRARRGRGRRARSPAGPRARARDS